ncbi:MAG TPA: phosphate ABC transporter permease subunit PstC [Verrucomicrobiae bacterium]
MQKQNQNANGTEPAWNPVPELCGYRESIWVWLVERGSVAVSGLVIALLVLIFVFMFKESMPIMLGQMDNARSGKTLTWAEVQALKPEEQAAYLGLKLEKIQGFTPDILQSLVELKAEEKKAKANPDTALNTTSWMMMLKPYQWTGYEAKSYVWQPNSEVQKYNIIPLAVGSLKISIVAILVAVPLAVIAALYLSQMAPTAVREIVKPAIEMLAGIPTVVLGFFGLMIMATVMQNTFGYEYRLNVFVAGVVTALAIIPIVFTVSEDALSAVPIAHRDAAYAMGASPWYASIFVVLPAAMPGVAAAVLLGFGRAIGETMIALMISGNAFLMGPSFFEPGRTIPATIGSELAETAYQGQHYRILFLIGTLLFCFTFVMNLIGDQIIHHLKARLEGSVSHEHHTVAQPEAPNANLNL